MLLIHRIARPMLASIFVVAGFDTLRNPESRARIGGPVVEWVTARVPALPSDPVTLVRLNAATQLGAGALLAIGRLPRLCALILAASMVPTTAAGHRFWELEDPGQRAQQRVHLLKNIAITGGLLATAGVTRRGAASPRRATARTRQHTNRRRAA